MKKVKKYTSALFANMLILFLLMSCEMPVDKELQGTWRLQQINCIITKNGINIDVLAEGTVAQKQEIRQLTSSVKPFIVSFSSKSVYMAGEWYKISEKLDENYYYVKGDEMIVHNGRGGTFYEHIDISSLSFSDDIQELILTFKYGGYDVFDDFEEIDDMVFVQGGTFTMGSNLSSPRGNEMPPHQVTVNDFYISKYPVTQALWKQIMRTNPSANQDCNNCPVDKVNWNSAQAFIQKLNAKTGKKYRLPTEAEWEFAARGGNQSNGYKYSGSDDINVVAWYNGNSGGKTHPVGTKAANELNIYDMSGNVFEWVNDWYADYSSTAQTNPRGPSNGTKRILRGGSWYDVAEFSRVTFRNPENQGLIDPHVGFRLVRSAE
jgi:hypothetical protein